MLFRCGHPHHVLARLLQCWGRGSHEEARCFAVRLPVDVTRSGYMGLKFQMPVLVSMVEQE